jgi:3-oxoadipate enol-lactonase
MTPARFSVPVPGGILAGDVFDGPARGGNGVPIALLHGFTLDRHAWDDVAPRLAAAHRVVRIDLRGHGASTDASAPYIAADEVPRVLDALGVARAALVGLSWGGQVALETALAHPDRVSALALVDATLPGHAWSVEWRAMGAELRQLALGTGAREGPAAAARAWFASQLFASARANPAAARALARWQTRRAGALWGGRNGARTLAPKAVHRLAEVAVPTFVVVGERDLADFRAIARTLAEGIPGARSVTLSGVGHLPPLEAPRELADRLLEFLATALPGA